MHINLSHVMFVFAEVGIPHRYAANKLSELTALEQAVNALRAHGGGDCPELGMTGILNALSLAAPDSNVIVLTDASPKDASKQAEVIDKATQLRNSIHFFLSRTGCGNFTPYIEVANATFGIVVKQIDDFEAFVEFAGKVGRFSLDLLNYSRRRRQVSENCMNFTTSIFTTAINILFSSVTSPITVTTPSGVVSTLSSNGSIVAYSNDDPESGEYHVCSRNTFKHIVSLSLSLDFFVEYFGSNYSIAIPGKVYMERW